MDGVAVNTTLVPGHIVLLVALDAMLTLAGRFGFTVIVMEFDIAGDPVKHGLAFDVITTDTTSPFDNAALLYVDEFDPTLMLFNFHW